MAGESLVEQTGFLHWRAHQDLYLESDSYLTSASNSSPVFSSNTIVVHKTGASSFKKQVHGVELTIPKLTSGVKVVRKGVEKSESLLRCFT